MNETADLKPTVYFSVMPFTDNAIFAGFGFGWDKEQKTACFIVQFLFWIVLIGPHHASKDRIL